ncbi:aldehyde dehydrogenase family protein [Bacillus sp. UNC438CL73TsuS30]|uniref:aldehyde dehydrogenase family protein n=1 Tax=Bacillus sp. UNC438CL73TsuS30 TaxID=1340434 RepID=UPI00047BD439|nr:aldehyde dehydrogenase family protein [Bacillus sp. UNC438CL73TsuS30]
MVNIIQTRYDQLYINGEWVKPVSGKSLPVYNPATGEVLARVAAGEKEDAQAAIRAARQAFDCGEWRNYSLRKRGQLLNQLANKIEENASFLSELETMNNGKTIKEAKIDIESTIQTFRYYAGLTTIQLEETLEVEAPLTSKIVREPIGVCAQIIPWNYPLLMAAWKLAPALAAGNVCILKPSEFTPLTAIHLFEYMDELDFPKGVVNLLNGTGIEVGAPLVESNLVDKIAFTGGTATGKTILTSAVGNLKKVSLELGGKSANIIFNDADFETALDYGMFAIFNNSGQVCSAGSRLLVERGIYDRYVNKLVERTKKIRVGNGMNSLSQMGPLINERQLEKVLNYVEIGKKEASLACGGTRLENDELKNGYFISPTIFTDVYPDALIAQEEIFGPVLCIIPFEGEEEAIKIANGTPYGLASGIFTLDVSKAERVSKSIRAGVIWINTYEQTLIEGPWGGYKESGIGRELGTYGLEQYTEVKHVINNMEIKPTGWFD